jgi:hypothetical protein
MACVLGALQCGWCSSTIRNAVLLVQSWQPEQWQPGRRRASLIRPQRVHVLARLCAFQAWTHLAAAGRAGALTLREESDEDTIPFPHIPLVGVCAFGVGGVP